MTKTWMYHIIHFKVVLQNPWLKSINTLDFEFQYPTESATPGLNRHLLRPQERSALYFNCHWKGGRGCPKALNLKVIFWIPTKRSRCLTHWYGVVSCEFCQDRFCLKRDEKSRAYPPSTTATFRTQIKGGSIPMIVIAGDECSGRARVLGATRGSSSSILWCYERLLGCQPIMEAIDPSQPRLVGFSNFSRLAHSFFVVSPIKS